MLNRTASPAIALLAALACGGEPDLPDGKVTPEVEAALAVLPGDAWAVLGINAARARRVLALKKLLERLPAPPLDPALAGACGLDPLSGIDVAVASFGGRTGGGAVFIALRGAFTRDSIAACAARLAGPTGQPIAAGQDGPLTNYGRAHVYWPSADLLVLSPASEARAALAALAAAPRSGADALMTSIARVRTDAAFWLAGALEPAQQEQLVASAPGVPTVLGFFASIDGEAGHPLRVTAGLRLAGDDEAAAMVDALRDQRPALAAALADPRAAGLLDRMEIRRSDGDVALHLSLTDAELESLVDAVLARLRPEAQ